MTISYTALGADTLANALTSRFEIRAYKNKERTERVYGKGFVAPINPASVNIVYSNSLGGQAGLNSIGPNLTLNNNNAEIISFKLILTDSSTFHYMGRNIHTVLNNYEVDHWTNFGYGIGLGLEALNTTGLYKDKKRVEASTSVDKNDEIEELNSAVNKGGATRGNRDGHVATAIERFLNLTTQKVLNSEQSRAVFLGLVWGRIFTRPGLSKKNNKVRRMRVYPCYLESVDVNYTHFTRDGRVLRAELDCTFKEDSSGG